MDRKHIKGWMKHGDFIIIDLPPVNIVADALVISKWTDGLVGVVRQNYTDKKALSSCMYQVEKLGVKFLGFIMTDADVGESSYKKYGKYGKNYGYGYDYAGSASSGHKEKAFIDATVGDQGVAPAGEESLDASSSENLSF